MKRTLPIVMAVSMMLSLCACNSAPQEEREESVLETYYAPAEQEEEPSATHTVTMGERNALSTAKTYLDVMAFSYSGLIEQLEYEGFTHNQAIYGAEQNGY